MTTLTISQQEQAYRDICKWHDTKVRLQEMFPEDSEEEIDIKITKVLQLQSQENT